MTDIDRPIRCTAEERACVATAAQIISAKWTPQLIYAMANGVNRFCELQKEVGGINPRTLSARLDELEQTGIVKKMMFAEVPPRVEYRLTPFGERFVPLLDQIERFQNELAREAGSEGAVGRT